MENILIIDAILLEEIISFWSFESCLCFPVLTFEGQTENYWNMERWRVQ